MDKTPSSSIVLVGTSKLLYQLATTSPRQGLSPPMRQAMWRLYVAAPKYVHRPSFEENALKMVPITFIWPSTKWVEKCEILPYTRRRLTNNSMGTQYISSCLLEDFAGLRAMSLTHSMSIRLPTTQEKGICPGSWPRVCEGTARPPQCMPTGAGKTQSMFWVNVAISARS